MKCADLVLKHKWYDMIAKGDKLEEYRDIKPFWEIRLKRAEYVRLSRGYTSTTMMFKIKCIRIGVGRTDWGADGKSKYFIIELTERQY